MSITLRLKKNPRNFQVKLQFGEYVSLGKVEALLKTCPLVEDVCIYGDSTQSFCVALVVPERGKLAALAEKLSLVSSTSTCLTKKVRNLEVIA